MASKVWTVDTWVLYKAAELDFDAITFLANVLLRHFVVLDYEGHIQSEYERCKSRTSGQQREYPGGTVVEKWLAQVMRRKAVFNYSGQLQARHRRELERLRFDPSDMPFVAVCYRTPDKLLVAEESDYNEPIKEYLNNQMGIQVLTIAQALAQVYD